MRSVRSHGACARPIRTPHGRTRGHYRINTDADENAYLLYRYMIRTTPTLIYFRKGDEIRRCEGPLTYQELLALQEQVETVEHVCLN